MQASLFNVACIIVKQNEVTPRGYVFLFARIIWKQIAEIYRLR